MNFLSKRTIIKYIMKNREEFKKCKINLSNLDLNG